MASHEIAYYSREDVSFGRDEDGNFTVTIKEGATADSIKVIDNDKGDGENSFAGGRGHEHDQTAYGEVDGTAIDGVPIQPVASAHMPGDPDSNILAISMGGNYGYCFTFKPEPGETYSFDRSDISNEPCFDYDKIHVACFVKGAMIHTHSGPVKIEDLLTGDRIWTEQNGYQPLRWVGHTRVAARGDLTPIRIRAGAFGADADLWVSPQHRMLVSGALSELLFNQSKILIAAKELVNDRDITFDRSLETVEYYHIMFDRHQIVRANGTLSESFYPDHDAVNNFSSPQRDEIFTLFPQLHSGKYGTTAYPDLSPNEAALLAIHLD